MTDINTRGKLPFTVVSSSVNTGYAAELSAAVGQNIDLVNHHKDEYSQLENSPLQGPFTQQHVGGNQHRHANLNSGADNGDNRAEGYFISASQNSIKIYGPDVNGVNKPRSILTRDFTAKSPVNIKNIQTSGNVAGNFEHNYQVVQNVGRGLNNSLIADGFEANGDLTTKFVNNLDVIIDEDFSSYLNGNKLTSNVNFLGDGTSEIRTETSTSKKYFVLNTFSGNIRFLKILEKLKENSTIKYALIANRSSSNYDSLGLNLERPENTEDLLLQYSYDDVNWITYKTILTGSNANISEQTRIQEKTTISIVGSFYLRFAQINHSGFPVDNYGITDIEVISNSIDYSLPDITRIDAKGKQYKDKTTIVQRFNAPGGKEESSRGALDRHGEEFAPNNSLTTRNIKVRQPYYNQLTQHSAQFNSGSTNKLLPDNGNIDAVTIHGINRNTREKILTFPELISSEYILSGSFATGSGDYFGISVAMNSSGDRIIVGAYQDETGSNGEPSSMGLAYIYENSIDGWVQQAVLSGSLATGSSDAFGYSVAINSSGDRIVVGAYNDETGSNGQPNGMGLAYIYTLVLNDWKEEAILSGSLATGSFDYFGNSVALNSIGNRIVVGAYNDETGSNGQPSGMGLVYMFLSGTSGWTQEAILSGSFATGSSDQFGYSVAMNSSGDRIIVGAYQDETGSNGEPNSMGLAYIYVSGTSGWIEQAVLSGSLATGSNDRFGNSVSMNSVGDRVIVGAYLDERTTIESSEGASYIFVSGAEGWKQQEVLFGSFATGSNDRFGYSVAMNSAGDRVVVGAYQDETGSVDPPYSTGITYVYVSGTNGWTQKHIITGSSAIDTDDGFGSAVAINSSGDRIVVGAYFDESPIGGYTNTGLAYVFNITQEPTVNLTTHDNFWVQHSIPATDLRYKWIADSVSSSQPPIEYQSFNSPYGAGSLYNSNAAFSDIEFEQKGPFGDHLGISGAIDKEEMFVSTHTNTMYRDRKYFNFVNTSSSLSIPNFNINLDNISSDIDNKSFSVSFWYKFGGAGAYEAYDIIRFSGSLGWNRLSIEPQSSPGLPVATYLRVYSNLPANSGIDTSIWEKNIELPIKEGGWHFITLVNDINTTATNSITKGEIISVYCDGGLVYQENRPNHKFIIDKIRVVGAASFSIDGSDRDLMTGTLIDEIIIWDTLLTEEQINNIYKVSKADYKQRPKKYFEHQFEGIDIPSPIHLYSSRLDVETGKLIDELARFDATLQNFVESNNLLPQNTQIISYSTYFNGPYQGASWKSIRKNEHPITRKLNTEDTNIISVVLADNKTTKRVNESPIQMNNKPLKHVVKLKNSTSQNTNLEIKHSYLNNLKYFANNSLDLSLGLQKNDNQMYNILYGYYTNNVPDDQNPIEKVINYTYSETIFPNPKIAGLKETRQRIDYITDQPGYSIDGYDRQLGTQRVFWRDNQEDRMRTAKTYINSIGEIVESYYDDLPFQTPSVAALEEIKEIKSIQKFTSGSTRLLSRIDAGYKNAGELNNKLFYNRVDVSPLGLYYLNRITPAWTTPELYFFNKDSYVPRMSIAATLNVGLTNLNNRDPACLASSPRYIYEHYSIVENTGDFSELPQKLYVSSTFELGLSRNTEQISGIKPWYDSYENYYEDIKLISNSKAGIYSTIPEFKISDKISSLVKEYGGNERNITLDDYIDDVHFSIKNINNNNQLSYKDLIEQENSSILKQDNISLKINGIKKLLPYNGFYPQDYSIKLVNYLKDSYIDTGAVKGGFLLISSSYSSSVSGTVDSLFYHTASDNYLEKYCKESAFLEPFYSPGIFYNLIKSGIAVDWSVYTGSIPINRSEYITNMNNIPSYKIPFESILDIFNGLPISSSTKNSENRIMKSKEYAGIEDYYDFGKPNLSYYYNESFFELENKSNPLYSLAINNFFAETINLFLKESKLTSFISKPETQFSQLDSNKTYYMDVILRNDSIVMVDAHSSSLFKNYGNMKGMYFGPSVWTGSQTELDQITSSNSYYKTQLDPAYSPYTPPYFYGESVATLSFKPFDGTRRYSLDEIINNLTMSNNNKGLIDDPLKYPSGSLYNSIAMPVEASVDLFGFKESRNQTTDYRSIIDRETENLKEAIGSAVGTVANNTGIKEWVISTKMETPVLDFSDNEYIISNDILSASATDLKLKETYPSHTPLTASGFGIGMWSGYGKIPVQNKGIYLQLVETHPDKIRTVNVLSNTGSLLQACGFGNTSKRKKIGELNNAAEISEAIIIIPYSTIQRNGSSLRTGFSSLLINDTVKIENHNLFKINEQMFQHQKQNISLDKPAVSARSFTVVNPDIAETSISRMIKLMTKYVLPPNFDFLTNLDIKPFVMYIAEFTSKLSEQDLANMWQGVMPSIAMKAEVEDSIISHPNNIFEFFHGQGLPSDVKFMIFKAKKRAEINYYKMTAKSTDDNLFPKIAAGRRESPYSFNWPYDYCSLVETAKVDVELEYVNISGSNT